MQSNKSLSTLLPPPGWQPQQKPCPRPAVEPPLLAMRAPHLVARAIGADGRRAALLNVLRVVLETGTARRAVVGDPDNAVPGTLLACAQRVLAHAPR